MHHTVGILSAAGTGSHRDKVAAQTKADMLPLLARMGFAALLECSAGLYHTEPHGAGPTGADTDRYGHGKSHCASGRVLMRA